MERSIYVYGEFIRDLTTCVDECYLDRIGDLARVMGAKLAGKSSNPSPTGTLLDILHDQGFIREDNIEALVAALEENDMSKAADLARRYATGLERDSKYDILRAQLTETYKKMCQGLLPSCPEDNNNQTISDTSPVGHVVSVGSSRDHHLLSSIFGSDFQEQRSFILIGQSGSGKTTACLQLISDWLVQDQKSSASKFDLVIFVPLGDVDLSTPLVEFIRYNLLPVKTELTNQNIENALKVHMDSLLFIFDSLDDVNLSDSVKLNNTTNVLEIGKVLTGRQLPSVSKLVTSSQSIASDYNYSDEELHLCELQDEQISEIIKDYFHQEPHIGSNVLHHIRNNSYTYDFCKVPLLLRLICEIAKRERSVHIGKIMHMHDFMSFVVKNIFEKYRDKFYEDADSSIDFEDFSRTLGHLALEILLKNQRANIEPPRSVSHDEKCMVALAVRAGFIKEVYSKSRGRSGSDSRLILIRFKNKIIQHYFAALRLDEISRDNPDIFDGVLDIITKDSKFHFVLLFLCGVSAPCSGNVLGRIIGVEAFRVLSTECLYERQSRNYKENADELRRWLTWLGEEEIEFRGDMSRYQHRATLSLIQKMKTEKINISSVHLNNMTSSLCLEMMSVGAPIQSMTVSDVDMTLFKSLPDCPTLMKLQICDVDVGEADLLQIFRWASRHVGLTCLVFKGTQFPRHPATNYMEELQNITNLAKFRVFREDDGDSSAIYSELDLRSHTWRHLTAFEFCKFQFENGLMNESELKRRTKQPNMISRSHLDADCVPMSRREMPYSVPDIVLGHIDDEDRWPEDDGPWLSEAEESLVGAQKALHADMMTVTEFIQCLQRLHLQQKISTSQFMEEVRVMRNTGKIDEEMCFDMILGLADSLKDRTDAISFLEDVRQLVKFQKVTSEQYLKIAQYLAITKAQLPIGDYIATLSELKEKKEITKEQFMTEIDDLKNKKLIGNFQYIRLRLSS